MAISKNLIIVYALVVIIILFKILNLFFGIDSIWDEGFLLLKYSSKIQLNELSLYPAIIQKALGIKATILVFKFFRLTIQLVSVCFIFFSLKALIKTNKININEKTDMMLFPLCFLFFLPSFDIYTSIVSYNHLQQFFFFISMFFLVKIILEGQISLKTIFFYALLSLSSILSLLTIVSSGVVILVIIGICHLIVFRKKAYRFLITFFSILIFEIFIIQWSLFDLKLWFYSLSRSINSLTTSNRGYDSFSMLGEILGYGYFILKLIPGCLFIYLVGNYLKSKVFIFQIVGCVLIILVIYTIYETLFPIYFSPLILIVIYTKAYSNIKLFSLTLILLSIPLAMSLGTNTSLVMKSVFYIPVWLLVFIILNKGEIKFGRIGLKIALTASILSQCTWLFQSEFTTGNILSSRNFSNEFGNLNGIGIRQKQLVYFQRINKIIHKYDLNAPQVFCFQMDHFTAYLLNGQMKEKFFSSEDFLRNTKPIFTPDIIFLTDWERKVCESKMLMAGWNLKMNYDKYFVSSPEDFNAGYSTERWMYVRKPLN